MSWPLLCALEQISKYLKNLEDAIMCYENFV